MALRIEHYQICVSAKIAGLSAVFQAKVGELVGSQYSRVGTPDIEEVDGDSDEIKARFYEEVLYRNTAWVTPGQRKSLRALVHQWKRENPEEELDENTAKILLGKMPQDIDLVAERATNLMLNGGFLANDEEILGRVRTLLANDAAFQRLVRSTV